MTDLQASPVARRTTIKWKGRRIIVELRGDDTISLRLERLRDAPFVVPLLEVFRMAERHSVDVHIPQRKR